MESHSSPLPHTERPPPPREDAVPWTTGDIAWAILVLAPAILVLVAIAAAAASGLDVARGLISMIAGFFVEGLLIGAAWGFSVRKHRCSWGALGFRGPYRAKGMGLALAGALAALAVSAAYVGIIHALGWEKILPSTPYFLERGPGILALGTFLAVLAAPVAEEAFFRGFVFGGLRGRLGSGGAAAVSAGLFALAHLHPATFAPIFVIGLLLAWVYLRTGSLWYAILAHLGYNSVILSLSWDV